MSKNLMAHESAVASVKMSFQMILIASVISFSLHIIMTSLSVYPKFNAIRKKIIFPGSRTIRLTTIMNYYLDFTTTRNKYVSIPPEFLPLFRSGRKYKNVLRKNSVKKKFFRKFLDDFYKGALSKLPGDLKLAFSKYIFVYTFIPLYILFFLFRSRGVKKDIYLRGTTILSGKEMKKKMMEKCLIEKGSDNLDDNYKVSNISLPREAEQKHILILGSTGTGKTVLMNQLIGMSLARIEKNCCSEKSVFYDIKGELISKHYHKERDYIFYPFDHRSLKWSFMNEIRTYADMDVLSTMLFEPPKDSKDPYWYNAARDIFRTGILYLYLNSKKRGETVKNFEILDFFSKTVSEIRDELEEGLPGDETGALKHIEFPQSPQAASVISVLQEKITFFKYIRDIDGSFSFRNFISKMSKGNLFLPNIKQNDSIFKPLMSFIIDLLIRETLSLPDISSPGERRINFFIDEFGSLSKLPSIFDFLTMARSKGGALCIVNQDLGSVSDIYGKDKKETFFNNFNTNFIFMLNDPTTAEFLSKAFGEQEIIQKSGDRQISPNSLGDTYTHREQFKINRLILPSQFISLEPFQCYFKHSGTGFCKIEIEKKFFKSKNKPFIRTENRLNKLKI